jgi:hypothetical protein
MNEERKQWSRPTLNNNKDSAATTRIPSPKYFICIVTPAEFNLFHNEKKTSLW